MKVLRVISRLIVGITFMFSGFVKGVDPIGLSYKMTEYMEAYHLNWFIPAILYLAIIMCMIEFAIGAALVFNLKPKIIQWLALIMMGFFTVLTLLSAINNPVSDCGCFGDAIKLSNWETFYKNIVLLALVLVIIFTRNFSRPTLNYKWQIGLLVLVMLFPIGISVYSYNHLPLIDFLPWKVGNKISEQVVPTPEIAEVTLVYKDKKTGEKFEYTAKTLPYQDSVKWNSIEFVEQKKKVVQPYKAAPVHDFNIIDENGVDQTASIIANPGYQFILVAHSLEETNKKAFLEINAFQRQCEKDSISFVGLTGSGPSVVGDFRHEVQAMYPVYSMDETALKTMIRANPGLILLKNGEVLAKWHYNDFPDYKKTKEKYLK